MARSWPPSRLNVQSGPRGASTSGPSAFSIQSVCAWMSTRNQPGPQMGKILAAVEEAQLEGELKTAAAARAFVKKNFPLAKKPAGAVAGAKRKGR